VRHGLTVRLFGPELHVLDLEPHLLDADHHPLAQVGGW
jgi:hypothetical protein